MFTCFGSTEFESEYLKLAFVVELLASYNDEDMIYLFDANSRFVPLKNLLLKLLFET